MMNKTKKFTVSLFLVMVMLMAFCVPAMATETKQSVEIPVNAVGKILHDTEKNSTSTEITPTTEIKPAGATIITGVYRSGNTQQCQVYLFWSGTDVFNALRFTSLTVKNTSDLFPITYGTFGAKTYSTVGSSTGSVLVGTVNIPTNVTQVRITANGLQMYRIYPSPAGWISGIPLTATVTIN